VVACPSAVAENQPANKHRMNIELYRFAARLRESINSSFKNENFDALALELFALQFKYNSGYKKICEARRLTPPVVEHWTQIPAVPTAAFKELELTSLAPDERVAVFHSSGTTEQKPSRHFHSEESLAVYETALWNWYELHFGGDGELIFLTPNPIAAPHSSLVHMFETIRGKMAPPESVFTGNVSTDASWTVDFAATIQKLNAAAKTKIPMTLLGTAFSFVHLLDHLAENNLCFQLPENSRAMETGGYKNRSRVLPKTELHALITERLGIPPGKIFCEYGMSELSSQAYSVTSDEWQVTSTSDAARHSSLVTHHFKFPPWARVQVISPETSREVCDGESGLIRIFDLANVFSVAAIQTEDLGVCRGDGFELIGRAQMAEPRGCSLMTA